MIEDREAQCPYCWETIALSLDLSAGSQAPSVEYTEDCPVCCQPMRVQLRIEPDGRYAFDLEREND